MIVKPLAELRSHDFHAHFRDSHPPLTYGVYANPELRFNKYSIVIASGGYNQLAVRKRSGNNVLVGFRYGSKRDEIQELLDANNIQYNERH